MSDAKAQRSTAYHEAAHAVIAFLERLPLRYVTVVPDAGENTLGHCGHTPAPPSIKPDVEMNLRTRAFLEGHVRMCLAGGMAEARLAGRQKWSRAVRGGAAADLHQAVNLIDYFTNGSRETQKYLDLLWVQTEGTVSNPQNWSAIDALAGALLQKSRIGGRPARQIINEALFPSLKKHRLKKLLPPRVVKG